MNYKEEMYLQHFGVKGMKWGVRTNHNGKIRPRVTLNWTDREEQKWVDDGPEEAYSEVYRKAQGKIRSGVRRMNSSPKYFLQDFKKDSPLRQEYYAEYSKMVTDQLNAAVGMKKIFGFGSTIGQSPEKRFELKFEFDMTKESRPRAYVKRTDTAEGQKQHRQESKDIRKFKHSEELEPAAVYVDFELDENGYILDFTIPTSKKEVRMSQQSEPEDIYHWGILGMRWGVRRKSDSSSFATDKPTKKYLTNAESKQLEKEWIASQEKYLSDNKNASPDSPSTEWSDAQQRYLTKKEVAYYLDWQKGKTNQSIEKWSKKQEIKELSTKDLADRIKRIQLESMYSQLTMSKSEKGMIALKGMLGNAAKQVASQLILDTMKTLVKNAQTSLIPKTADEIPTIIAHATDKSMS